MATECCPQHSAERRATVITGITAIAHITTKQEMSRWTRAHADAPGITWSVFPGEGGTMIIVEHTEDRCSLNGANGSPEAAGTETVSIEDLDIARVSA
jgi:hypothetical protein